MKIINIFAAAASAATLPNIPELCEGNTLTAVANFDNGQGAVGQIFFRQDGCNGNVSLSGTVKLDNGSSNANHGYHIHQYGDVTNGCGPSSTGGHFNPYQSPQGHFSNDWDKREVGQIGQVTCNENGELNVLSLTVSLCLGECSPMENPEDKLIRLYGLRSVLGRSLVIHANPEPGPGGRIACATIALTKVEPSL